MGRCVGGGVYVCDARCLFDVGEKVLKDKSKVRDDF